MMNPHSIPSPPLSALTQPSAICVTKESFLASGSDEARYSGSLRSHGLKVMKSGGFRTIESTATGRIKLKSATAAETQRRTRQRDRSAVAIPRPVC